MMMIGCDFHPSSQQVSWLDTETGEAVAPPGRTLSLTPPSRLSMAPSVLVCQLHQKPVPPPMMSFQSRLTPLYPSCGWARATPHPY